MHDMPWKEENHHGKNRTITKPSWDNMKNNNTHKNHVSVGKLNSFNSPTQTGLMWAGEFHQGRTNFRRKKDELHHFINLSHNHP